MPDIRKHSLRDLCRALVHQPKWQTVITHIERDKEGKIPDRFLGGFQALYEMLNEGNFYRDLRLYAIRRRAWASPDDMLQELWVQIIAGKTSTCQPLILPPPTTRSALNGFLKRVIANKTIDKRRALERHRAYQRDQTYYLQRSYRVQHSPSDDALDLVRQAQLELSSDDQYILELFSLLPNRTEIKLLLQRSKGVGSSQAYAMIQSTKEKLLELRARLRRGQS